jgi:hypothetical protein
MIAAGNIRVLFRRKPRCLHENCATTPSVTIMEKDREEGIPLETVF